MEGVGEAGRGAVRPTKARPPGWQGHVHRGSHTWVSAGQGSDGSRLSGRWLTLRFPMPPAARNASPDSVEILRS
jgi:hypothetical protein